MHSAVRRPVGEIWRNVWGLGGREILSVQLGKTPCTKKVCLNRPDGRGREGWAWVGGGRASKEAKLPQQMKPSVKSRQERPGFEELEGSLW